MNENRRTTISDISGPSKPRLKINNQHHQQTFLPEKPKNSLIKQNTF